MLKYVLDYSFHISYRYMSINRENPRSERRRLCTFGDQSEGPQRVPAHKLGKLETGSSAAFQRSGIKAMTYFILQGFNNMKKRNVYEKHGTEHVCV